MTVRGAARLHFGFLDMGGFSGRRYGSVGLSISAPGATVSARASDGLTVTGGDEKTRKLARDYAARFTGGARGADINLKKTIPAHVGLGSGTQLALCVMTALRKLYGVRRSVAELAALACRGARSGIGIESFKRGGFIIDAGSENEGFETPLPLIRRFFPPNWRAVLIIPPAERGLSGEEEDSAISKLVPDSAASAEICRLVLMKLLPGLMERKIEVFGDAIERMQRVMGESFSGVQSGCFASPMAEDIFVKMREMGARGMGQSSWGPVLYGFVPDPFTAALAMEGLRKYFGGLPVRVVSGRNHGANVSVRRHEQ